MGEQIVVAVADQEEIVAADDHAGVDFRRCSGPGEKSVACRPFYAAAQIIEFRARGRDLPCEWPANRDWNSATRAEAWRGDVGHVIVERRAGGSARMRLQPVGTARMA